MLSRRGLVASCCLNWGLTVAAQYRIGEFSELSGVSAKTLRFYDEIGLLRPTAVDPRTGYRHYSAHQLDTLASIVELKSLGVSLSDLRSFMAKARSSNERRRLLEEVRRRVEESIQTAQQSLKCIDDALDEISPSKRSVCVVLKRRAAIPVASVRAKVDHYTEVVRLEQQLLETIPASSIDKLRGVLWHRCADSGSLEAEPFVRVKHGLGPGSFYDVKSLPAVTLACAYSDLDDDAAEAAYDAIRRWMNVRGYVLAGPKREIYLDSALEIQFPLKSA
jgi:DNA-binding transcriptional MerR regulator